MTEEQLKEISELIPTVYHELFSCKEDIASNFQIALSDIEDLEILYAFYEYEDYSGSATVFYYDPKYQSYFEVRGGHCSCYGLEGQWSPEEIGFHSTFIEYVQRVNYKY